MFPARPKGTRMTTPLDTETEPEELPPTNQEPLRQLNGVQERISASVLRLAMRFESKPPAPPPFFTTPASST
jgi:hypothetical protein